MTSLPTTEELFETANVSDDILEGIDEFSDGEVYSAIRYYYRNYTDIDTVRFEVDGEIIESNLYDANLNIEKYTDKESNYSNYSIPAIKRLGYDTDVIWNGPSSTIEYHNGEIKFGKTDYYTTKIPAKLFYLEALEALTDVNGNVNKIESSHFPLRDKYLSTKSKFEKDMTKTTGGASGGILFGKENGEWYMILGKRSSQTDVNSGMNSMAPNGGVEYVDLQNNGFKTTLKREFNEELEPPSDDFMDEHIDIHEVAKGWDIRSGKLAVGYALFVESEDRFKQLIDLDTSNFEFERFIKISINNVERILENVNSQKTSPSVIPTIYNGLKLFDEYDELPSLEYEINQV